MSAESMQNGQTKTHLMNYEKLYDHERRIIELKKERAVYDINIAELNNKIKNIDDEILQLQETMPFKAQHNEHTIPLHIHPSAIDHHTTIDKHNWPTIQTPATKMHVIALNDLNYYGLIMKHQIMFCINYSVLAKVNNYILYLMPSRSKKHAASRDGDKLRQLIPTYVPKYPCYYAEATYIELTKNSLEMWTKLYNEKLFPFWNPEGGPYKFNNDEETGEPKPKFIAICKVYGLNTTVIGKDDINRTPDVIREITNTQKVDRILKALNKVHPANEYLCV